MKWQSCIKQASRELKGTGSATKKSGKRSVRKPAKKKARKVSAYRQTGTTTTKADRKRKAKAPGKRVVRHAKKKSTVYYERRKNRSDVPGKLSGAKTTNAAYQQMILSRMWANTKNIEAVEMEVDRMKQSKLTADKIRKKQLQLAIDDRKKYIASLKADNRMLKRILK